MSHTTAGHTFEKLKLHISALADIFDLEGRRQAAMQAYDRGLTAAAASMGGSSKTSVAIRDMLIVRAA